MTAGRGMRTRVSVGGVLFPQSTVFSGCRILAVRGHLFIIRNQGQVAQTQIFFHVLACFDRVIHKIPDDDHSGDDQRTEERRHNCPAAAARAGLSVRIVRLFISIDRIDLHRVDDELARAGADIVGQFLRQRRIMIGHRDRDDTGVRRRLHINHVSKLLIGIDTVKLVVLQHCLEYRAGLDELDIILRQLNADLQITVRRLAVRTACPALVQHINFGRGLVLLRKCEFAEPVCCRPHGQCDKQNQPYPVPDHPKHFHKVDRRGVRAPTAAIHIGSGICPGPYLPCFFTHSSIRSTML